MHNIEKNLARVQRQIDAACRRFHRDPKDIRLLAVSKTKPVEDILEAYACGQRDFGESYLQDSEDKILALQSSAITWHFIGPMQSNKTRRISALFDWVHSVDRLKIARRLNDARPQQKPPLNVLLQVNIDADPDKSGISPGQIDELSQNILRLPRLRLRGLMAIPSIHREFEQQRRPFAAMHRLFGELQNKHPECDTLSMGMSADIDAAIAEGSTLVRIGTAIFGARETTQKTS